MSRYIWNISGCNLGRNYDVLWAKSLNFLMKVFQEYNPDLPISFQFKFYQKWLNF
jgi:hypothetical protein